MDKIKIGVIGCGSISGIYIKNLTYLFNNTEVIAVSDILEENAKKRAEQFNIPIICKTNDELLSIKDIDIVLILTEASLHAELCLKALNAGKNVYTEKPLANNRKDGIKILKLAKKKGLKIGCAPDSVLLTGIQISRKLIDDGWIGKPFGATCHMAYDGPESWHPNPFSLYQKGAGILFEVGPYFITALAYLLGSIESVMCQAKIVSPRRKITSQPHYGEEIIVEEPTYAMGILNFKSNVIASIFMTNDVQNTRQNNYSIEIYGLEGTLMVPSEGIKVAGLNFDDYGAIVKVYYKKNNIMPDWIEFPFLPPYKEDTRGIGLSDLADSISKNRPHRLTGDMAYHVVDVIEGFYDSMREGVLYKIESSFDRTAPLKLNLKPGEID